MSFSTRRATLLRILEIEENIKSIEHSKEYILLKRNLKVLENSRSGGGVVVISSPDDLNRTIEMRRNSGEIEACIAKYRARMRLDSEMIDGLNLEKSRLKRELQGGLSGQNMPV
jgi:vacuolar-type H+-ATPase subunit E/Vma4